MILTKKEIQYGFSYYFKDERDKVKSVITSSEIGNEECLSINCTQIDFHTHPQYKTDKSRKELVENWCNFLIENPNRFTELTFGSRVPQKLFDAICHQKRLKKLEIKWGAYPDISKITNLENLNFLNLGPGANIQSIKPITKLKNLVGLHIEYFRDITDYSSLSKLNRLKSLCIEGNGSGPQFIEIESLDFLKQMTQLKFLKILTFRLKSKDYSPILELKNLEHLTLRRNREVKKAYNDLIKLPNLKWGLLKEKSEIFT